MTDFPALSYTSTIKIPTLVYTWSLKKVPFSGGASCIGHLYGVLRARGQLAKDIPKKYLHLLFVHKSNSKKGLVLYKWILPSLSIFESRIVGTVFRILDRNSPAVWNTVSVFHENLNLSNIWYDYDDSFYFGRAIEISKQISNFLQRIRLIRWEFLKIGRKCQTTRWSRSSETFTAIRYRETASV